MYPIESIHDFLRSAFERGDEDIFFGTPEYEYRFIARYNEWPLVRGMLFVADEEAEQWLVIADTGDEYVGDTSPEPWKGLPSFLAEKIASAASLHSLSIGERRGGLGTFREIKF